MNEKEKNSLNNKWKLANKITSSSNQQETKINFPECKAKQGAEQRVQEDFLIFIYRRYKNELRSILLEVE